MSLMKLPTTNHLLSLIFIFVAMCGITEGVMVSDLSFKEDLKPGENRKIKLTLTNERNEPERVDLKQCDYGCNADGQHFFEAAGTLPRSNAKWISLSTNQIVLAPNEKTDIYLTLNTPNDSQLKGSYWSILLISPTEAISSQHSDDGFNLQVRIQYASHIVTNIGAGNAKLKIVKKGFKEMDGKKYLYVDVENTGDLFLNPKLNLKLYNSLGKLYKAIEAPSERLYPGNSQRYFVNIEGVEKQKYTAFLMLDNGDNHLFGDTSKLDFP